MLHPPDLSLSGHLGISGHHFSLMGIYNSGPRATARGATTAHFGKFESNHQEMVRPDKIDSLLLEPGQVKILWVLRKKFSIT